MLVLAVRPVGAQVTAAVEVGAARVEYDGFLPANALTLSPTFAARGRRASVALFGSYLHYETGNSSVQGEGVATLRPARFGPWQPELTVGAGVSAYEDVAQFGHARVQASATYVRPGWVAWVEGLSGLTNFEGNSRPALSAGAGVRRRFGSLAAGLDLSAMSVGDTSYVDLIAVGRWIGGRFEAAAFVGARGWSTGGGSGVFAEATGLMSLTSWMMAFAGAGRYPSDPLRGSIAGRYVSGGIRVTTGGGIRRAVPGVQPTSGARRPEAAGRLAGATLTLVTHRARQVIRVVAPDVESVRLMGDFTGWEPVELSRKGSTMWEMVIALQPGVYRLNVQLDDGPWVVPFGVTELDDGFGGRVGQIIVR